MQEICKEHLTKIQEYIHFRMFSIEIVYVCITNWMNLLHFPTFPALSHSLPRGARKIALLYDSPDAIRELRIDVVLAREAHRRPAVPTMRAK